MSNYKEYTGLTPEIGVYPVLNSEVYPDWDTNNPYNFEETVIRMLEELDKKGFNLDDFYKIIEKVRTKTDENQERFRKSLEELPLHLRNFLALIRPVLTTTGRQLVNKDKVDANGPAYFETNLNSEMKKKGVTVDTVKIDPRKNPIILAKMIRSSNSHFTPLFTIKPKEMFRKTLGKFLLEIRVSSPVLNFKGFITSGMLENERGCGFFSSYNHSAERNGVFLVAYISDREGHDDTWIDVGMIRTEPKKAMDIYDRVCPTFFHITPLVCEGVELYNNIGWDMTLSMKHFNNFWPNRMVGACDLSNNGFGPIDCKIGRDSINPNRLNFEDVEMIQPKYFPGNRNVNSIVRTPVAANKRRSKWLNLKVHPTAYFKSGENRGDGDYILRPPLGKSHFDMMNLFRSIFEFVDGRVYKCFGHLLVNSTVIPVETMKIDYANGRVSFGISPFFTVPGERGTKWRSLDNKEWEYLENKEETWGGLVRSKKEIETKDERRGQKLAYVIFDTNMNAAYTWENNGFYGDINGKNDTWYMGQDSYKNNAKKHAAEYDLHFIDLMIEIPGCNINFQERLGNKAFRYSGAYNRNFYFMDKGDSDTYPYPGVDRNVTKERTQEWGDVFVGNPESYLISFAEGKYIMNMSSDSDSGEFYDAAVEYAMNKRTEPLE